MRDLKADKVLCDAATPGPWKPYRWGRPSDDQYHVDTDPDNLNDIQTVATCKKGKSWLGMKPIASTEALANAAFIAAAREALPHYIERTKDAEAEVERLRQKLECAETLLCLSAVQEALEGIGDEWYAEWLKNRALEAPHA
jgi:hypothetical protein